MTANTLQYTNGKTRTEAHPNSNGQSQDDTINVGEETNSDNGDQLGRSRQPQAQQQQAVGGSRGAGHDGGRQEERCVSSAFVREYCARTVIVAHCSTKTLSFPSLLQSERGGFLRRLSLVRRGSTKEMQQHSSNDKDGKGKKASKSGWVNPAAIFVPPLSPTNKKA